MKRLLVLAATCLIAGAAAPAAAQAPADAARVQAQRAQMDKLAFLDGRWEGEGWVVEPGGRRVTFRQTERVGPLLSGGVRLVEGRGIATGGPGLFNAFAVLSPAAEPDAYEFRSYAEGRAGTFKARLLGPGHLVWEIPAGPSRVSYVITVRDGVWREVGTFNAPGAAPRQFFEMTVRRTGPADWTGGAR